MTQSHAWARTGFISTFAALVLIVASHVPAACPLYDNLRTALDNQAKVEKETAVATLSPATEKALILALGPVFLNDTELDVFSAMILVKTKLTDAEEAEAMAWWDARGKRQTADDAVIEAQEAFYQEYLKGDQALKNAQAEYDKEVEFLNAERAAIQSMPKDDAYYERTSKMLARLKAAYHKMQSDLAPYEGCSAAVRKFLADKERRLLKIDALEAEIARRKKGGDVTTIVDSKPAGEVPVANAGAEPVREPGDPEPPGPLGDEYILQPPTITPINGGITRADIGGIDLQIKQDDGTLARSSITIAKLPAKIRVNQLMELSASASGDQRAYICGDFWATELCDGQAIFWDAQCANSPSFKSTGNSGQAKLRFYFRPHHDLAGKPATVVFKGGRYNGEEVKITWTYARSGG